MRFISHSVQRNGNDKEKKKDHTSHASSPKHSPLPLRQSFLPLSPSLHLPAHDPGTHQHHHLLEWLLCPSPCCGLSWASFRPRSSCSRESRHKRRAQWEEHMGAGWRGSGSLSGSLGDGCRNRMIGVELVVADAGWRRVRTRCAGKAESFGDG